MNERNTRVVRTPLWFFVNEANTGGLQPLQGLFDVVNSYGYMMHTFAAPGHKLSDR